MSKLKDRVFAVTLACVTLFATVATVSPSVPAFAEPTVSDEVVTSASEAEPPEETAAEAVVNNSATEAETAELTPTEDGSDAASEEEATVVTPETYQVSYKVATSGGIVTVEYKDEKEIIRKTEEKTTLTDKNGVVTDAELTEEGYALVLEVEAGTEVKTTIAADDGYDAATYRVTTDAGTSEIETEENLATIHLDAVFEIAFEEVKDDSADPQETADEIEADAAAETEKSDTPDYAEDFKNIDDVGTEEAAENAKVDEETASETEVDADTAEDSETAEDADAEETVEAPEISFRKEQVEAYSLTKEEEAIVLELNDIQKYIYDNADSSYVPTVTEVEEANVIEIRNSIMDADAVSGFDTIDSIMPSDRAAYALMGLFSSYVLVYDLDPSNDYLVAMLNTLENDPQTYVQDVDFAVRDASGTEVSGCYYDKTTGLAYIPRSAYLVDGVYQIGYIAAQLMQVSNASIEEQASPMSVSVTSDKTTEVTIETSNIYEMQTVVPVVDEEEADQIDKNNLLVMVNDIPLEEEEFEYDNETGEVIMDLSSATVNSIEVVVDKPNVIQKIIEAFSPVKVEAATIFEMPFISQSAPVAIGAADLGKVYTGTLEVYYGLNDDTVTTWAPDIYSYNGLGWSTVLEEVRQKTADDIASGTLNYHDVQQWTGTLANFQLHLYNSSLYYGPEQLDLTVISQNVNAYCSHITNPLFGQQGTTDYRQTVTMEGAVSVLYVNEADEWAILGILSQPTSTGQSGYGLIKVTIAPQNSAVTLKKTSSNTSITDNNSNYSLAGAVYGVYSDAACTTEVGRLTTDANGNSNTVADLAVGTYYVKEITAPKGYQTDTSTHTVNLTADYTADNPYVLNVSEEPGTFAAALKKVSANTSITNNNSNYSLSGAVYGVYSNSACTTEVGRLTTDASGNSNTLSNLAYGTYYVKEITAPKGYIKDTQTYTVNLTAAYSASNPYVLNVSDQPGTGYAALKKTSSLPAISNNNRLYSLEGAQYTVYTNSSATTIAKTVSGTNAVLTTNAAGNTNTVNLPLGTYYVKETKAPKGYKQDTAIHTITLTASHTSTNPYTLNVADVPGNDPIRILLQKADKETKDTTGQGGARLEGAEYTVKYYDVNMSTDPSLSGETAKYTWVFKTDSSGKIIVSEEYRVSGDNIFTIDGNPVVPLGTLTIQETKAPDGYELDDKLYVANTIMETGGNVRTTNLPNSETYASQEQPKRGDFYFIKVDEESTPMAGIPFLITSKTTGESHVIVSDADGHVDTSRYAHSSNTNANDALLKSSGNGGYIITDESKLDATAGIWFGEADANDDLGALLYDEYIIEEIPVAANYGKNLWNVSNGIAITGDKAIVSLPNEVWVNRDIIIGTTAKNTDNDAKVIASANDAKVTDTVRYENLTVGDTYTMEGKIVDKADASIVYAEASTTFTPTATSGTVDVNFTFDASELRGKDLVVFETLIWKGGARQNHADINDTDQTVYIPDIRTKNIDLATGDQVGAKNEEGARGADLDQIQDTVSYTNLPSGEVYVLKGQLVDLATGEVVAEADTGDFSVRRGTSTGTKSITFSLDTSGMEGHTLVAFETLYLVQEDGSLCEIVAERDLTNEDQMVFFPQIATTATDGNTLDHVGTVDATATIVDAVACRNLVIGKEYTINGTLMDKETGEPLLVNGETVTAETTFTAEEKDPVIAIVFTLDASALEGKTVVAFEDMYHNGILVETHADLEDEAQTVHYPKVRTSAIDTQTGDDVGVVGETSITDTVILTNLIPGNTYTVSGILKNQADGQDVILNGEPITQTATFTVSEDGTDIIAEGGEKTTASYNEANRSVDGTIDLIFTLDAALLANQTVVVFEDLYHNDIKVAVHNDLNDKGQTVHYPEVRTNAVDSRTGDHVGSIFGELINWIRGFLGDEDVTDDGINDKVEQTIYDTVTLKNLVPGRTYTVEGVLMNQETGEPVVQKVVTTDEETGETVETEVTVMQRATVTVTEDGKLISENGEKTEVTAYDAEHNTVSGSVVLTFKVDSSYLQGATTVVFEDLYHNNVKVAFHNDINDNEQSVHNVEIHTTAIDTQTGDHVGKAPVEGATSTIDDTVAMAKLVKGATYTVTGKLVDADASTDESIVYLTNKDGQEYTSSITFVADEEHLEDYEEDANGASVSGNVHLYYSVENEQLQGKTVVVFEDLYHNDVKISTHSDITDESQTVYYPTGKTNATDNTDGMHQAHAGEERVTITDKVYFENLLDNEEYTIEGSLRYQQDVDLDGDGTIDRKAGDIVDAEGAVNSITFTVSEEMDAEDLTVSEKASGKKTISGYVNIEFTISTKYLAGVTLVAFENFKHNGIDVFTHNDLQDKPQTIRIPKIGTTASVDELDEAAIYNEDGSYKTITLTDTVRYENLWSEAELAELKEDGLHILDEDGREVYDIDEDATYIMKGILMDKETGKPLVDADGKMRVSYTTFKAASRDGEVDVIFTLDPADFLDEETGESTLEGKTIVVFETLYRATKKEEIDKDRPIAEHEDLEDEEQDVRFPKGRTHATDTADGTGSHDAEKTSTAHEAEAAAKVSITDVVTYENLHANTEYTVTGTLQVVTEVDADGKATAWEAAVDDEGNAITQSVTFTTPADTDGSDSVDGSVELVFTFSGVNLAGKTTVAFETISREGKPVIVHADINDEAQTIYFPNLHTNATDAVTMIHEGLAGDTNYIIDAVSYENLEAGKTYRLTGRLFDRESGEEIKNTTVTGTFVAGAEKEQFLTKDGTVFASMEDMRTALTTGEAVKVAANGTDVKAEGRVNGIVYVVIPIDTNEFAGKTSVAFETLTAKDDNGKDKEIARHEDIEDEEQSVSFPKIRTTATVNGKHSAAVSGNTKLIDTVSYTNLKAGQEYTISGTLMDKATGKELKVDGKAVTAETTFTPETSDGTVEVTFKFNSSALAGKTVVVYETLTTKAVIDDKEVDVTVGEHKDINDEDQSVKFTAPLSAVQTGDVPVWPFVAGAAVSILVIAYIVLSFRKRKNTVK